MLSLYPLEDPRFGKSWYVMDEDTVYAMYCVDIRYRENSAWSPQGAPVMRSMRSLSLYIIYIVDEGHRTGRNAFPYMYVNKDARVPGYSLSSYDIFVPSLRPGCRILTVSILLHSPIFSGKEQCRCLLVRPGIHYDYEFALVLCVCIVTASGGIQQMYL